MKTTKIVFPFNGHDRNFWRRVHHFENRPSCAYFLVPPLPPLDLRPPRLREASSPPIATPFYRFFSFFISFSLSSIQIYRFNFFFLCVIPQGLLWQFEGVDGGNANLRKSASRGIGSSNADCWSFSFISCGRRFLGVSLFAFFLL